jgi:GntR family transcriptional regulator/MocR family aminotransferase
LSTLRETILLDPNSSLPRYQQLYRGLRAAILDGQLAPGARVPATRVFARELGVSRATVQGAFDQLMAEGYLEGKVGSGSFVARSLPEDYLSAPAAEPAANRSSGARRGVSQRGASLAEASRWNMAAYLRPQWPAFPVGVPALDMFPHRVWSRLLARRWRQPSADLLNHRVAAGYLPLREQIAAYVATARGVRCSVDQVIVVAGAQHGLDLAARVLLDPGDMAWVEDPGYIGARGALVGAGVRVAPVPVDGDGLDVAAGRARFPQARLAYITPSHQFPLGVTLSLTRRLALLEWAHQTDAWIVEDDYDSEFRYAGRPLAALQGIDQAMRTIYVGSFSKVLFPALRLGYLVVPPDLVDAFVATLSFANCALPALEQAVLAEFMAGGHFTRHLREMRVLYGERQQALAEQVRQEMGSLVDLAPSQAGMHLVAWLPDGVDDQSVADLAAARQVTVMPLSRTAITPPERGALLLGYAVANAAEMRRGVRQLTAVLDAQRRRLNK